MLPQEGERYSYLLKVVLIGDSGVGKTNLLSRYSRNEFLLETRSTIGVDLVTKTVQIAKDVVKVQIWDTAGQEQYRAIAKAFYRGAAGALLVYDIAQEDTFRSIAKWLKELRENCEKDMVIVLVGNKSDLRHLRQVPREEGVRFAEVNGLSFIETSALETTNVKKAFDMFVNELYQNISQNAIQSEEASATRRPGSGSVSVGVPPEKSQSNKRACC